MQAQQFLEGFEAEANGEQNSASRASYWSFMINIVGSFVATVAVLVGSFAVWTWLKKRQGRSVE